MPDVVFQPECVVVSESDTEVAAAFRDIGIATRSDCLPFGMAIPDQLRNRPSELICVGGSVSFEFAVPALLLAHESFPDLKYIHLSVDSDDHFGQPESVDYEITLHYWTETAAKYECKPWSDRDFHELQLISRQSDFHYFLRSFYKKNVMILREDNSTLVKYIGGIHDGEELVMQGSAHAILSLLHSGLDLGRIRRQNGKEIDIYTARINGSTLEFHFDRTEYAK